MRLPEIDEAYLREKGYQWELFPDGNGACLVISDFAVAPNRYDRDKTDLLIRIPAQYNIAGLDMFYVSPELKFPNGSYPEAAGTFQDYVNRRWQRFSRHLTTTPWRPGVDGLRMFMTLIGKELQAKA